MKLIKQSHEVLYMNSTILEQIEITGRTCYQSQNKITEESAIKFVKMLQTRKHNAMIEFADITVRFITNRGVTHELVRHRPCSFAQESTRYVRYDGGMEFIQPVWSDLKCKEYMKYQTLVETQQGLYPSYMDQVFIGACLNAEDHYIDLLNNGWRPEQAREVLPNALKTEICVKANIREWLHIFSLRTSKAAHPQIRELMAGLLQELSEILPTVFGEVY